MPGLSLVGIDSAGGLLSSTAQAFVRVNGSLLAVVGTVVSPHGVGPHAAATMTSGSTLFKVNGTGVIFQGKLASCGHAVSGSLFAMVSN
jgi:uncharacterized Zn-binding protein involved in type VI secretion